MSSSYVVRAPAAVGILFRPSRVSLIAILRVVALNELVEVFTLQRSCLQGEVLVGSEIIYPELLRPRCFAGRLLVEEENIGLHALRIEQASRETKKRVDIALVQQLPADRLPCPAFEKNIVRYDDRRAAVLFQQGFDVLKKVQLLVGGRRPEIVAFDDFRFPRHFAVIRHDRRTALLAEGRIGHHDLVAIAGIAS